MSTATQRQHFYFKLCKPRRLFAHRLKKARLIVTALVTAFFFFFFFPGRFKSLALARPVTLTDAQTFVHTDDNKHRSQHRWVLPSMQEGAGWRPCGFNFPATDQRQAAECLACLQTNIPDRKRGYTNETSPAPLRRSKASCAYFLIKLLLHSS